MTTIVAIVMVWTVVAAVGFVVVRLGWEQIRRHAGRRDHSSTSRRLWRSLRPISWSQPPRTSGNIPARHLRQRPPPSDRLVYGPAIPPGAPTGPSEPLLTPEPADRPAQTATGSGSRSPAKARS
ncbi:hypothetical protein [Nonomuraea sp. NPDC049684]|uniref:hypothetical protein n=1 Tax=Nonomuraea sp. NPDC049684 TaxID=3364356 RepID=UPI0037A7DA79